MINNDMRTYNYFTFGGNDAYGQAALSKEVQGVIKIAISISNQTVQDNINYKGATYIGITHGDINDTYVIDYEGNKLKVLYVNPKGRFKVAYLANYE